MTLFRKLFTLKKSVICTSCRASVYFKFYSTHHKDLSNSEYSKVPQYPPIDDISALDTHKLKEREWHRKIQKLPTVEQKLMELNMPKYYGYKTWILDDQKCRINGSDFIKFLTRTHVVQGIPKDYYSDINVDHLVEKIRPKIEELIYLHHHSLFYRVEKETYSPVPAFSSFNSNFNYDLNNLLMKTVQEDVLFPPDAVDIDPRIEGFWLAGGFDIPERYTKMIKNNPIMKHHLPEHRELFIRSTCKPSIAVRSKLGLPEVVGMDDSLSTNGDIPLTNEVPKSPQNYGIHYKYKRACIIPGFWPGLNDEHSQLFIYPRVEIFKMHTYSKNTFNYHKILLENKAMIAGFTQALSFALYQGFTPVNEVSYPFTNQTVTTDGINFKFSLYQMNTCALFADRTRNNPRNNVMWISEDIPLFTSLEGETVKGLNENVLRMLLVMYLKKGVERTNPAPYLADYKYLANHKAPAEYKDLFQKKLRKLMREEDMSHIRPSMDIWEQIYKVMFKTRPMDAPKKWFETKKAISPSSRRLDEYQLEYINRYNRINPLITKFPRLNSEHLFVHDLRTMKKCNSIYPDDMIAFNTLNVLPNSDRYRTGKSDRKWRKTKHIIHTVDPALL